MSSLVFRRVLSSIVALALTLSPCLSYAAPPQDHLGVLVEFDWQIGDVHTEQRRWELSFAAGSTGDVQRSMNVRSHQSGQTAQIGNEILTGYFQERSPYALKWSIDAFGRSVGLLYGLPMVAKFTTPVLNATGSSAGSFSTVVASPWIWGGAIAIGLAAAAGGGGNGDVNFGGSDGGGRNINVLAGSGSCGTNGGTVVGNDGAVNTDDPSDPRGPTVDTACIN